MVVPTMELRLPDGQALNVFLEALRIGYWGWFDDDMAFDATPRLVDELLSVDR